MNTEVTEINKLYLDEAYQLFLRPEDIDNDLKSLVVNLGPATFMQYDEVALSIFITEERAKTMRLGLYLVEITLTDEEANQNKYAL